jgi:pyruvate dehydrogenase E2 component (dihydrolipoamide acetyltransferase)
LNRLSPIKFTSQPSKAAEQPLEAAAASKPPRSGYTDTPLTSMRTVIAKRLSQSKSTSPHGYATAEANIDGLNAIRNDFKV